MSFEIWLAYLLTELLLIIIPGPAVLFVTSQGLRYGATQSYVGSLGIACGNLVYFILSALGLLVIINSVDHLFTLIKILGAIYLIVSGVSIIYKSFRGRSLSGVSAFYKDTPPFIQGLVIQLSNPKAIIFFTSILPQFINQHGNIPAQFFILSVTTIVPETIILMLYGWLSMKGKDMAGANSKLIEWKERIAGSALVAIGARLFF